MSSTNSPSTFWKVLYFLLITPLGYFLKLIGLRLVELGYSDVNSYWNIRSGSSSSKENYKKIG